MKKTIQQITDIVDGLPADRLKMNAILKQFNVGKFNRINSGTLIFDDGQIYMLWSGSDNLNWTWKPFTKLKPQGLKELIDLIDREFSEIDTNENFSGNADNFLIWESNRFGNKTTVIVPSGPFSGLPPVFKKIEDTINKFMVRLNEKI